MLTPYTPRTPQSFWCGKCDTNTVDSTKPETGDFYVVFGHAHNRETMEYDSEEYLGVMFALCKFCQESSNNNRQAGSLLV